MLYSIFSLPVGTVPGRALTIARPRYGSGVSPAAKRAPLMAKPMASRSPARSPGRRPVPGW